METHFQTSFIPKKPIASVGGSALPPRHRSVSIFLMVSVLVFVLSLAAAAGTYVWKNILISAQDGYKVSLVDRQKQFNPTLISQLKDTNVKIDMAKQLLANHLAISEIFDIVSRLTIENVRFFNLDVITGAGSTAMSGQGNDIKISMRGSGANFSAVAFQSDVLNKLEQYGLRTTVKNPILSDPVLDSNGAVSFGFSASISQKDVSYTKSVSTQASQ